MESFEQRVNKPTVVKETTPVKTVTESIQPITSADPIVPQIQTETFESEQSVFPSIAPLSTPDSTIEKPQIQTQTKLIQAPIQPSQPITPRITKKAASASASPDPVIKRETVSEPEHEIEIVEHVIEHSSVAAPIERQITREITRPVTRQITRPVTRRVAIENTIENTTEKTIEHTIENTAGAPHHQQQLTSSFTTLIPNTPPRLLPTLKSRQHTPVPVLPNDAEQP
ncbi:MAG TPA: hypothetical protein VJS17_03600, partial [Pyrinomonadaceae bacterium]|nr:hypothetical protein [Pyrinomonadaceae bacterium]